MPLANADAVGVINTDTLGPAKELDVAVPQGAGSAPVAAAVTPDGGRLLVAQSAADEVSVYAIPGGMPGDLLGRIPTADYPTDVSVDADGVALRSNGSNCKSTLLWTAAKGFGLGPTPDRRSPASTSTSRRR